MAEPDFQLRVTVEASLRPSEDPAKLRKAVENVLGDCRHEVSLGSRAVRLTSDDNASLRMIHDQLRDRHVRAAARKLLLRGREGRRATLMFKRQAAFAGVLALCGSESESPLGPINLTIESDKVEAVIDWLTAYIEG